MGSGEIELVVWDLRLDAVCVLVVLDGDVVLGFLERDIALIHARSCRSIINPKDQERSRRKCKNEIKKKSAKLTSSFSLSALIYLNSISSPTLSTSSSSSSWRYRS